MNVLVIGGGGREHALCWKLAQSAQVETVFCAPGNAGMTEATCVDLRGNDALADFAAANGVGLTVVGPEADLCAGIVDEFRARGLSIFGPDRNAAQLEGSKAFAKKFMARHGIPTGAYMAFDAAADAKAYIHGIGAPIVVKASGLAAGKGVIVAMTEEEAVAAVDLCFAGEFGEAGDHVLIEEFLPGEEASILAFVDRDTILPMLSSQDHKAVEEGDKGPNTGGMGAYAPAPVVDDTMWATIHDTILRPFLDGCRKDGLDYCGIIYVGLMILDGTAKVIEFNVRFGDPEVQVVLALLESDLAEAMSMTIDNRLCDVRFQWAEGSAVCVVMASGGYPGSYEKGKVITGLDAAADTGAKVFHAGTARDGEAIITAGGRVLGVTACGHDIEDAVRTVYAGVDCIQWEGTYFRRDIAHRATGRLAVT